MKTRNTVMALLFLAGFAFSQSSDFFYDEGSQIDGGVGMTWIGGDSYYTLSFRPDISIGKLGIGLGVQLLYNTETGEFRSQDFDEDYDWARIIRYIRWGHKGDPFFTRIGALDAERLGHGFILNYYNNRPDWDQRKIGLMLDADFGYFGFESMTNNLGRMEVVGGRGYVRPLFSSDTPIIRNMAVGASYVTDVDPDRDRDTEDNVSVLGFDVEFPLVKTDPLKVLLYADHAQIADYGSGQAVGVRSDFHMLGSFIRMGLFFERRFLGKEFIANYFGSFYEMLRFSNLGEVSDFYESQGGDPDALPDAYVNAPLSTPVSQHMLLPMIDEKRQGWFGGLGVELLHLVRVMGSYQMIDDEPESGTLHLGALLSNSIPIVALEASYDKRGMDKLNDMFTLDYRSLARVGVGYKIKPYLHFYMDYIWNFEWDEARGQYKPQERIQPRIAFRYNFGGF